MTQSTACRPDLMASLTETFTARFGIIPEHHCNAVIAYLTDVEAAALPDVLDGLTASDLDGARNAGGPEAVERIVGAHLDYIDRWHTALDSLDANLRDAFGRHNSQSQAVIAGVARDLFAANDNLQRAVITHYHGGAGPRLDPDYGFAYALSNGTVSPFTD